MLSRSSVISQRRWGCGAVGRWGPLPFSRLGRNFQPQSYIKSTPTIITCINTPSHIIIIYIHIYCIYIYPLLKKIFLEGLENKKEHLYFLYAFPSENKCPLIFYPPIFSSKRCFFACEVVNQIFLLKAPPGGLKSLKRKAQWLCQT